jgi:hypothetical protein
MLEGIACLFPWHVRQKQAARRLWKIVAHKEGREESANTDQEARKYALRLSQELICQDVCHQPFESGLVHQTSEQTNQIKFRRRFVPVWDVDLTILFCIDLMVL